MQSNKKKIEEEDVKNYKSDMDIIREEYRFVREEEDDDETCDAKDRKLALQYEQHLYREYCVCDLSRYTKGQIGLRWRIEREVRSGKGESICGSIHCEETNNLTKLEVNFAYKENNEEKNTLVKVSLCTKCSKKMSHANKKKRKQQLKSLKRKLEREQEKQHNNKKHKLS
jgi:protein FRA10AC1